MGGHVCTPRVALALPPPPGCLPRLFQSPPQPYNITPELPVRVLADPSLGVCIPKSLRSVAEARRGVQALEPPNSTTLPPEQAVTRRAHPCRALSVRGERGCCRVPSTERPTCRVLTRRPQPGNAPKTQLPSLGEECEEVRPPDPWPFPPPPSCSPHPEPPTPPRLRASARPWLPSELVGHWASVSRWARRAAGLGPPRAALLVGEARQAKGRLTRSRRREGHRGVWVVDGWAEFLNLSFFF